MARMTFFVADELANRFEEARKAGLIPNKSEIVQNGLEAELARLASVKGEHGIEAIASRIIAREDAEAAQESEIGSQDGEAWAKLCATSAELGRLKTVFDSEAHLARIFKQGSTPSPDVKLAMAVIRPHPDDPEPDPVKAIVFWMTVRSLEANRAHIRVCRSENYLRSFAAAAVAVWNAVAPTIVTLKLRRASKRS